MANLTKILDTPTSGKPISSGDKSAPSLFSAVADPIASFVGGMDNRLARDRMAAKDAKEAGRDDAKNAAEARIVQVAKDIEKIQAGVNQGRLPRGAISIQTDAALEALYQEFPDYKFEIADIFQKRGIEHWTIREYKAEQEAQKSVVNQQIATDNAAYDYALKNGYAHPNNSYEDIVSAGYSGLKADRLMEDIRKKAEATRALSQEERAQKAAETTENDRQAYAAVGAQIDTRLNTFIPQTDAFLAAAIGDVEKEKRMAELAPLMGNYVESERAKALSALGAARTPELEQMINRRFDTVKASLVDRFTGSISSYNMTKLATDHMTNLFKLNTADSLKAYSELSAVFGREAVNNAFNGQIPFSQEVIKKVGDELRGYSTKDAEEGRVILMRAAMLLKGQVGLKDLTEEEAIQQMPIMAANVSANQAAILKGSTEARTHDSWQNSYGTIVEASAEIQPGRQNLSSLWAGVRLMASPGARSVLIQQLNDPNRKEKAQVLLIGSRGSAAQAQEAAKLSNSHMNEFQTIKFNGDKYVVEFDQRKFEKWAAKQPQEFGKPTDKGYYPGPGSAASYMRLNKNTQDKLSIMNATLDHLVETAQYDPSVPKGVTPKQLREHYAKGTPLFKAAGKPMLSSDEEFNKMVDEFEAQIRTEPTKPGPKAVPITDIKFSSPIDAIVRTVLGESGKDRKDVDGIVSTILNRAGGDLNRVQDVVLAKGQFEPWGNEKTRQRLLSIDAGSKEYLTILEQILPIINGTRARKPYTHFYAPKAQSALGRQPPTWDDGTGIDEGETRFFTNPRGG